ncbi:MAG: hypothetical protein FWC55_00590 [Firmicutes bacterium]|nr:hypothetical protein [Bacillota bacterium]
MSGLSLFMIVLFVCSVAGLCILVVGAVSVMSRSKAENGAPARAWPDETLRAAEEAAREADRAIKELHRQADAIFAELNGKYQELLFLYGLIERKTADSEPARAGANPAKTSGPARNGTAPAETSKPARDWTDPAETSKSARVGANPPKTSEPERNGTSPWETSKPARVGANPPETSEPERNGTDPADHGGGEAGRKAYDNPSLARIRELANAGGDVAEIARELGMGQGEVRMIMNLGKLKA